MVAKDFAEKTYNLIKVMLADMDDQKAFLNADQTLELIKVHAMLAQAEATQNVATAVWSLGDSVERAGRNG